MPPARTSYELLVGRHVSAAMLATFPVALVPTAVPRKTVHRLRIGVESDIAEIVRRLTERDVALLEIRRCNDRPWWRRADPRPAAPAPDDGVVVLFPGAADLPSAPADEPSGKGAPTAPVLPIPVRGTGAARGRRSRGSAGRA